MLMKEIRRQKFEVLDFQEDVEKLAADASRVLGYNALRDKKQVPEKGLLEAMLAALGIEFLNNDDVQLYMRERLQEVTRERCQQWIEELPSRGEMRSYMSFIGPSWAETPIGKYNEPIPLHVVDKLVRIKEACPDAHIEIVHLISHPDPFARVWVGKDSYAKTESFWIDVWEEPKFEAKQWSRLNNADNNDEAPF